MDLTIDPGDPSEGLTLVQSFGIAAMLIVLGVMATWVYLKRSDTVDVLASGELELLNMAPLEAAQTVEPVALSELDTWVQFGEEAYTAGRVVSPAADNALYYYQKALAEDPRHQPAREGMERVVRHPCQRSGKRSVSG